MTNIWWLKFEEGLNFRKTYFKSGCSRLKWNWYILIIFFVCWLGLKTQPWSYSCQAKQFSWYFWGQYWGRATMSSGIYQKISVPSTLNPNWHEGIYFLGQFFSAEFLSKFSKLFWRWKLTPCHSSLSLINNVPWWH